jgi:hypothetical protein
MKTIHRSPFAVKPGSIGAKRDQITKRDVFISKLAVRPCHAEIVSQDCSSFEVVSGSEGAYDIPNYL